MSQIMRQYLTHLFFAFRSGESSGSRAGKFYELDHRFGHFNDHYNALIDLVVDNGRIVHIEMDEKLSPTHYNKDWASQEKTPYRLHLLPARKTAHRRHEGELDQRRDFPGVADSEAPKPQH